ncbi:MAG: hypothetical protein P5690_12310 [Limnospira sp. PMC 1236.20]|uniref:hypothetical protein n=1 Tax=Limnospira sp. PMC 1240.20 TaxID=2981038 RepID=UPI0002F338B2|nr:hypothetical protein [Limnospira sp. PMC 1240.20]MDT9229627.1 hypothetical protein [Limnospira sp. PMC 1242.20]MDT9260129.1 hypothetical protein [Limnospira sp. PMC 1236.20]
MFSPPPTPAGTTLTQKLSLFIFSPPPTPGRTTPTQKPGLFIFSPLVEELAERRPYMRSPSPRGRQRGGVKFSIPY